MPGIQDLRKKIEEKKAAESEGLKTAKDQPAESIDLDQVEKIVARMKKKYSQEGMEFEEVGGKLKELRGIITSGEYQKVEVQGPEELIAFRSPAIKSLGQVYITLQSILKPVSEMLRKIPITKKLDWSLYSANMKYSVQQWLALTAAVAFIAFVAGAIISLAVVLLLKLALWIVPLVAILFLLFGAAMMLIVPYNNAKKRGDQCSIELPFALRHMATELKAGIGLYKTLQVIAASDYGVLSEEFARTISEIEEGTDAKDALHHFALRTYSKALRDSLFHMIRAMKTGGSLSTIMNSIAEDVSFELRMNIRDFGEKMNFFGVIYIFAAIVVPVFVGIIGGVTNAPLGIGIMTLPPMMILLFYTIMMPLIMVLLTFYLYASQPKI
ncbi:MAG: type II secretion system F family protein [Candidatus Diapherotrites archaeon]